jgi:hypothetical protein
MVLALLVFSLVLDIVGLAMYMVFVPKANEGPFLTFSAMFIIMYVQRSLHGLDRMQN